MLTKRDFAVIILVSAVITMLAMWLLVPKAPANAWVINQEANTTASMTIEQHE